jgi:UDPglucose--hexose-1-phosphate uridylyltransferase
MICSTRANSKTKNAPVGFRLGRPRKSDMRDELDESVPAHGEAALVVEPRQDMVSGSYVLVSPSRAGRPTTVVPGRRPRAVDDNCPFCLGNESATAQELTRIGPAEPGESGWRVRVVQNRYPVVGDTGTATGQCEVIVFRSHDRRLEDLEVREVADILAVIRDRVAAHAPIRSSVEVFVNAEWEAGASIAHPHAQLIALDFIPPALELELTMIAASGSDPLQRDLDLARQLGLIVVDGDISAWCPWAAALPFSVRIAPRTSGSTFVELDTTDIAAVAQTLRDVLRAMNDLLDHPAYNVVLFSDHSRDDLVRRWRIEVVPRITVGGGFEIGTSVTTHATEAATAADSLRSQLDHNHESSQPRAALRSHS